MNNLHTQSIPQEILDQAVAKINEASAILKPYTLSLTPEERKNMLKMGDRSLAFVEKAVEFTKTNPEFIPVFMTAEELAIDLADSKNLVGPVSVVTQLLYSLDDTMMLAGSEAFYSALYFYKTVQHAASMNIPGAKAIYEELKKRYPNVTRKVDGTTPATAQ